MTNEQTLQMGLMWVLAGLGGTPRATRAEDKLPVALNVGARTN
jgi:hypothetical protein